MKYGQNHDEVAQFIEAIELLTPEQFKKYAYAADAAAAAYDAAAYAADYAAAYDSAAYAYDAADGVYGAGNACAFRRYFARSAHALAIKHLIGQHGFTQAHYDLLTKVVRDMKADNK